MIIAQISDPHLAKAGDGAPFNGEAALRDAVDHLLQLPTPPDVVLMTGDLADQGRAEEYARVRDVLRSLTMPVYVVPGHHDDRARGLEAFGPQGDHALEGFVQYVVDRGPVRLLVLDTFIPGQGAGALGAAQLDWLEDRLSEAPDRPTLLFMHHPPFRTGLGVIDSIGLLEPEVFGDLVARHPQIEGIATAHVHATLARRFRGTVAWTCGSTQHQLLLDVRRPSGLAARLESPTCLLHVWKAHTGLVTHTSRIGEDAPLTVLHDGERWL